MNSTGVLPMDVYIVAHFRDEIRNLYVRRRNVFALPDRDVRISICPGERVNGLQCLLI